MSARVCNAIVGASVAVTPPLFIWACFAAYAERGYLAVGGEFGILLLPLIVASFVYMGEDD